MSSVKLIWVTPDAEEMITHMARVSSPKNQENVETAPKLLRYLIKHKHLSPFEMANMCIEINTTRAISAQIIRHRSFSFQEFCLSGNAVITVTGGPGTAVQRLPIKELYSKWNKATFKARYARAYDEKVQRFIEAPILSVYESGEKHVYRFTIDSSHSKRSIDCTREHRVFTKERGFVTFGEAFDSNLTVALNGEKTAEWGKISSQKYIGVEMTYDIEMDHPTHNFVANGVVVHNSQRYSDAGELGSTVVPHLRRQDQKNRQNSIDDLPIDVISGYYRRIGQLYADAEHLYGEMISNGVAKECARSILPLGTPTRIYMNGTIRSWLTYIALREKHGTQMEHMVIAKDIKKIFCGQLPVIAEAMGDESNWEI